MYDALLQQQVLVVAPVMLIIADNPMSSELCNHQGNTARKFCRICLVLNWTFHFFLVCYALFLKVDKEVNPGSIGPLRNKQLSHRLINRIRRQTTAWAKKQLSTEYGLRGSYNPMDKLALDMYR